MELSVDIEIFQAVLGEIVGTVVVEKP